MNETLEARAAQDGAFLLRASLALARAAAHHQGDPAWLRARRSEAARRVAQLGLPAAKAEAWRFTSLRALDRLKPAEPGAEAPSLPPLAADTLRLVLRNGRFDPAASQLRDLPAGASIAPLELALAEERAAARFGELARAEGHFFNALNEALFSGGVLVRLEPGVALERPLHIVHVVDPSAEPLPFAQARVHLILERGASARVIERFVGSEAHASFSNPVSELLLQPEARLDYARLQEEGPRAVHLGRVAARLERGAALRALSVMWGAELARAEFSVELAGEGAEATLDGLYLPSDGQHHDHTLSLRHLAPHTQSRQSFKGILAGTGRAVFRGMVYVAPQAQKVDARQANKNLLLSPRAWVDTLPQLEIHADDVKCAHGATIGRLDAEALHYLRSRGIGRDEARSLLTFAFANEILSELPDEALRVELEARLRDWLATHGREVELA
jgi:Fe-S cluster assembly protein SufD